VGNAPLNPSYDLPFALPDLQRYLFKEILKKKITGVEPRVNYLLRATALHAG
jgi:hypothetical protein